MWDSLRQTAWEERRLVREGLTQGQMGPWPVTDHTIHSRVIICPQVHSVTVSLPSPQTCGGQQRTHPDCFFCHWLLPSEFGNLIVWSWMYLYCINVFPRPLVFILFTHERELLYFSPLTTFEPVRLWSIVQYAALKITTWGHKRVWCFGETGSIKDSNTMQFHTLGC